jgi:hypothetical protein
MRMYGDSCFLLDVVLANLAELPGPVNPIPQGSSEYCFGNERLDWPYFPLKDHYTE